MRRLILILLLTTPAWCAITRVHSTACISPSSGATTQPCTTSFSPTNGNTIIVVAWHDTTSTITAADGEGTGNTYTNDLDVTQASIPVLRIAVLRASNVSGSGAYTVTITSGASSFTALEIIEYSGITNSSPIDVSCSPTCGNNIGSANPDPGNLTTTNANDVLISGFGENTGATSTLTTPASYTLVASSGDGSVDFVGGVADRIVAATSTYSAAWTYSNAGSWAAIHIAYKAAAAGASMVPARAGRPIL